MYISIFCFNFAYILFLTTHLKGYLKLKYTLFPGQPDNWKNNEACAELRKEFLFMWNDRRCADPQQFLCEAAQEVCNKD